MHRFLAVSATTLAAVTSAACGSSGPSQSELDRARREGAAAARQSANEKETARLRKELDTLKNQRSKKASSSTPTKTVSVPSSGSQRANAAPSSGNCGGGLSVNGVTSCAFARNVRNAYSGTGSYSIDSPTTGKSYSMFCSGTNPTVCTGGNNAYVSFP